MERYRTWLFSPGDHPARCRKAAASAADQVIWDLEDGVDESRKDEARARVAALLAADCGGRAPWVRVNALTSRRGRADVSALHALCRRWVVPKFDRRTLEVIEVLHTAGRLRGMLLLTIETASGMWLLQQDLAALAELARLEPRLAFGSLDYTQDLQADPGGDEEVLGPARAQIVLASRMLGWPQPIDAVFADLADERGLAASAGRAKRFGFGGKLVVHPRQIAPVRDAFAPSEAERRWAAAVLAAAAQGDGAQMVAGQMVDRPVIARARRIIEAYVEEQPEREDRR